MDRIEGPTTIDIGGGRRGFRSKDTAGGVPGTIVRAGWLNQLQEEIVSALERGGLIPSSADTTQITRLIRSDALNFLTASGTANAVTLAPNPAFSALAHLTGTPLRFIVASSNTGPVTLAVNGLAATAVRKRSGGALHAGDLRAGDLVEVIFNGSDFRVSHALASDLAAGVRFQRFTSSGPFTVPDGVDRVFAEVLAGGGAGGASGNGTGGGIAGNIGAGGGAGGYSARLVTGLVPGSVVTVTVGAGGVPAVAASGGPGGTSSFGPHCSAAGGGGGAWGENTLALSGAGGAGIGGDINVPGGDGGFGGPNIVGSGAASISDVLRIYGRGGVAAGGLSLPTFGGTGAIGRGFGTGGGGASGGSGIAGGAGAPGLVIVRW